MNASVRSVSDVARPDGPVFVRKRALDQVDQLVADMPVKRHVRAGIELDEMGGST